MPSSTHVLVGVAGLLALLAVAVVVAVILVVELRDATDRADRHVEYSTQIQLTALTAKTLANDERGFLLSGDEQFSRQLREGIERARTSFEAAERAAIGNSQLTAIFEARAGFERWLQLVQREFATFRAGNRDVAVRMSLRQTRTQRHAYETALERAQALGISAVESSTSTVSDASWRAVRILLVYLVIALALGFVLTAWLVHTVRRPVPPLQHVLPEQAAELRRMR